MATDLEIQVNMLFAVAQKREGFWKKGNFV